MEKTSIEVGLNNPRAKLIADCIGNKTCVEILEFLAKEEGTVSDIGIKLKKPINTVDYNIKKLVKAGLIVKKSHFWSIKGKKMPVYSVDNKKIVISPKGMFSYLFLGISALVAGILGAEAKLLNNVWVARMNPVGVAQNGFDYALSTDFASEKALGGMEVMRGGVEVLNHIYTTGLWEWFILGLIIGAIGYLVFYIIRRIIERRKF